MVGSFDPEMVEEAIRRYKIDDQTLIVSIKENIQKLAIGKNKAAVNIYTEVIGTEVQYMHFLGIAIKEESTKAALDAYAKLKPKDLVGCLNKEQLQIMLDKLVELRKAQEKLSEIFATKGPTEWKKALKSLEQVYTEYLLLIPPHPGLKLPLAVENAFKQAAGPACEQKGLQEFLMYPMQRLLKYEALFAGLEKSANKDANNQFNGLMQIAKYLGEIANKSKKESELKNERKILQILAKAYNKNPKSQTLSPIIDFLKRTNLSNKDTHFILNNISFHELGRYRQALLNKFLEEREQWQKEEKERIDGLKKSLEEKRGREKKFKEEMDNSTPGTQDFIAAKERYEGVQEEIKQLVDIKKKERELNRYVGLSADLKNKAISDKIFVEIVKLLRKENNIETVRSTLLNALIAEVQKQMRKGEAINFENAFNIVKDAASQQGNVKPFELLAKDLTKLQKDLKKLPSFYFVTAPVIQAHEDENSPQPQQSTVEKAALQKPAVGSPVIFSHHHQSHKKESDAESSITPEVIAPKGAPPIVGVRPMPNRPTAAKSIEKKENRKTVADRRKIFDPQHQVKPTTTAPTLAELQKRAAQRKLELLGKQNDPSPNKTKKI